MGFELPFLNIVCILIQLTKLGICTGTFDCYEFSLFDGIQICILVNPLNGETGVHGKTSTSASDSMGFKLRL